MISVNHSQIQMSMKVTPQLLRMRATFVEHARKLCRIIAHCLRGVHRMPAIGIYCCVLDRERMSACDGGREKWVFHPSRDL
jgi:predicted protein tyrosine phosphatase